MSARPPSHWQVRAPSKARHDSGRDTAKHRGPQRRTKHEVALSRSYGMSGNLGREGVLMRVE